MTCNILVGGGWGDEGKGKCITYLCYQDKPEIIARAGVGPNAGHSVEFNGEKYGLRMIPSGFVHTGGRNRDSELFADLVCRHQVRRGRGGVQSR